jgi:peptidoglycan/LPS O-acetylase OafA/YrhL
MLPAHLLQAHRSYLGTRVFGSLDGLRGLCILGVIWHHAPPQVPGAFFERGFLGVDMFFVLSGFLIVTLLLRERDRTGAISLKNFYARRTLRIFPIYYLLIFVILLVYLVTQPGSSHAQGYYATLPFLLTYTTNWVRVQASNVGIMWSLATEEQFYLGWPMVEKLLKPSGVAVVLALVLLVNQLINFGFLDGLISRLYGGPVALPILEATFTPIALGVLLAHFLHEPRSFAAAFRVLGRRESCVFLGTLLIALIEFSPSDISGTGRLLIQLTMMMVLGAIVIREDHWARPLLTMRPLAYLGLISYGLYLYHMYAIHPVRVAFEELGWDYPGPPFFLASLAASTIVAGLSFRYIEQPLLSLKARFASDPGATRHDARPASPLVKSPIAQPHVCDARPH